MLSIVEVTETCGAPSANIGQMPALNLLECAQTFRAGISLATLDHDLLKLVHSPLTTFLSSHFSLSLGYVLPGECNGS